MSRFFGNKKILITAALLIGAGAAVTALNITNSNPDGYQLAVETLQPTDITQTKATFRANVTELDPIYDAALVYWNYTDGTNEYKGPATIATSRKQVVDMRETGLSGATGYDIEAYAEPIINDDDTLNNNLGERTSQRGMYNSQEEMNRILDSKKVVKALTPSSTAMSGIASSSTAMNEVAYSSTAMNQFFDTSNNGASINTPNIELSAGDSRPVTWEANTKFSAVVPSGTLTFDYSIPNSEYWDDTTYFEVRVNGNTAYSESWGNSEGSDSVSVSVNEGDTVELVARLGNSADPNMAFIDAEVDVSTMRIR